MMPGKRIRSTHGGRRPRRLARDHMGYSLPLWPGKRYRAGSSTRERVVLLRTSCPRPRCQADGFALLTWGRSPCMRAT